MITDYDRFKGRVVGVFKTLGQAWRLYAALVSALLLGLAFPPFQEATSIWFALVPLLLLARFTRPGRAFFWGWISGLVFWLFVLVWMISMKDNGGPLPLVLLGWLGLSAYSALFTGLFCAGVSRVWRAIPAGGLSKQRYSVMMMGFIALVWVATEWLRSTLFTGFSWNQLGISQYRTLPVLWIARFGGVYAVSFLIVVLNAAIAMTALRVARVLRRERVASRNIELMVALVLTAVVLVGGYRYQRQLRATSSSWPTARIGVVQPNTPSVFERGDEQVMEAYRTYRKMATVLGVGAPDLSVWPETSLYEGWSEHPGIQRFLADLAREARSPILMGATRLVEDPEITGGPMPGLRLYNASVLVATNGVAMDIYHKRHLVPFGEILPFDKTFPDIQRLGPLGVSCWPGEEATVFELSGQKGRFRFGTLICFEDTTPYLARDLVEHGAQIIMNQSNDAWFGGSSEPLQHMAHCVFRAVENGVSAVRATSVGVSCVIAPDGERSLLAFDGKLSGFAAARVFDVHVRPDGEPLTLYTRFGDWTLAIPAFWIVGAVIGYGTLSRRRRQAGGEEARRRDA